MCLKRVFVVCGGPCTGRSGPRSSPACLENLSAPGFPAEAWSPDDLDRVLNDGEIVTDQGTVFRQSLGDQQPVEWVLV